MAKVLPRKFKDLSKVLECLGFRLKVNSGRGGHYKYTHPNRSPIVQNQRPFIMLPRHNFDHGKLNKIVKIELKYFGFSEKEIEDCC